MFNFPNANQSDSYNQAIALFLAKAADIAYKNEANIKTYYGISGSDDCFIFLNDKATDTQGFAMANDDCIVIAFRGTESKKDGLTDAEIKRTTPDYDTSIEVHDGFNNGLSTVYNALINFIDSANNKNKSLWITGHSLGAALAVLATFRLAKINNARIMGLYTFGQPRVGNIAFAKAFDALLATKTYRLVNNNDIVTEVPLRDWLRLASILPHQDSYSHYKGHFIYFDTKQNIKSDLTAWQKLLDEINGRLHNLKAMVKSALRMEFHFTDGINDHKMANYIDCVAKEGNATVSIKTDSIIKYPL